MPETDREVFAYFLADPSNPREVALLAYASYAVSKYDWAAHFEQRYGRRPDPEEADEWTASQPESRLIEIRDTAITFFADAATAFMAKAAAVNASIMSEVQRLNQDLTTKVEQATSFSGTWKQGLFLGVAASFAFTALVIAGGFIFDRDPSPFGWFKPRPPAVTIPETNR